MDFSTHLSSYMSPLDIDKLNKALMEEPINGLLLNTKKMKRDKLVALFPFLKEHPIVPNAFIFMNKYKSELTKSIYYELGCYYIEEPSAMMPAYLLGIDKGDIVLDLCAAPGGKSIGLSLLGDETNLIISNDIAYSRLVSEVDSVSKMGLSNIVLTHNDMKKNDLYTYLYGHFDKVIVDAPCSGSAMFRKEPKMRSDWSYNKVVKQAEIQKELIVMAFDLLKPGGVMCYSTCSYSKEEDEDVIEYLLSQRECMIEEIPKSELYYVNKNKPLGIHLFPYLFPGEGQYICLVRKYGDKWDNKVEPPSKESVMYQNKFKENKLTHYQILRNTLYTLPIPIESKLFYTLNVIYLGVKIGEIKNSEVYKYDLSYARSLSSYKEEIELSEKEAWEYIKGHSLDYKKEGVILLKYDGLPLSFTKGDGRILKNWYPILHH
ncbi:MAG: hypothetical protein LUB56_00440 [Coprobacillus sp.]|nr:hypothetical protein [Coprobacillus sp.]